MHAVHIDTLKAVEELESTGIKKTQAKAFVSLVNQAFGENVATKNDLKLLKADMAAEFAAVRTEMAEVKAELKEDIAAVRTEIAGVKSELREDIASVRSEMATELASVRTEMATQFASIRTEMVRNHRLTIGIIGGLIALLFALDRILPLAGIN